MRFYELYSRGDNALTLVDESEFGYWWSHFVGKPMKDQWQTPKFKILARSRNIRDFVSWSSGAIILTSKAIKSLQGLIAPHVEFLPFATVKGKELTAVNVLELIDCLDLQKSEVTYAHDEPGRLIHVGKLIFDEKRIKPVPIFKVPQWTGTIFVSEEFARIVVREKLTGARFNDPEHVLWLTERAWDGTMEDLPQVRNFLI